MEKPPLILTLQLDEASRSFFDSARRKHFPPERNHLDAHLTLFHQLPDEPETLNYLKAFQRDTFRIGVQGLINLGAGVAYKINSEVLSQLHRQISAHFAEALIAQDRQPFRPHITIMNKTTPPEARALLDKLNQTFQPFTATATGLSLWKYLGGPWEHLDDFRFRSNEDQERGGAA